MSNPVIVNKAPAPESVGLVSDSVRMSFRDPGNPIDRDETFVYLGYGASRYVGSVLPEDSDYIFTLEALVGNPADPPDTNATITVEGDNSLKIDKYLAADFQQATYLFGRLEAPAEPEDTLLLEFTCKINEADTSPDGNDFTGVAFGLFFNDGGFMVRFFNDGAGTRWIEMFDADENSTQRPLYPALTYYSDFDWDGEFYTYKVVWDQQLDRVSLLVDDGAVVTELISGVVSDFGTVPSDQIRDGQPIAFFGHFPSASTSISYWSYAALYNVAAIAVELGQFQGGHTGFLRTPALIPYSPTEVPYSSDYPWNHLPDSFGTVEGSAQVVGGLLEMVKENPVASYGFYREEPQIDGAVLEFTASGESNRQTTQASGIEFYVDDGSVSARVGFLFDQTTRTIGLLGTSDPEYSGSYDGVILDWTLPTTYRLVFDPSGYTNLYIVESGDDGLEYVKISEKALSGLPASSLPGPGVGFLFNENVGQSVAKLSISSLWYVADARSYIGTSLPASPWVEIGTGTAAIVENRLSLASQAGLSFFRPEVASDLNSARGVYAEFRARVDSWSVSGVASKRRTNTGVGLFVDDGSTRFVLSFADAGPELGKIVYLVYDEDFEDSLLGIRDGSVTGAHFAIDWTALHTYRLEKSAGEYLRVFIDNDDTPAIEIDARDLPYIPTFGDEGLVFGSIMDDRENESTWEFVHYAPSTGIDLKIETTALDEEEKFDKVVNVVAFFGAALKTSFSGLPLIFDTTPELYEDIEEDWPDVGPLTLEFSGSPLEFD